MTRWKFLERHADDAAYDAGDISEQRADAHPECDVFHAPGICASCDRLHASIARGPVLDDFDLQTSAVLNNWWVSDPRNWES